MINCSCPRCVPTWRSALSNQGLSDDVVASRVEQALAVVSMTEAADRPPHHLSLGQRRRVAVATVLSMNPDVLVLDELSSNLDPTSRREIAELVLELNRTTVMVTHDLPYALQLCPRSVILSAGRIVADGPTRDLLADSPSCWPDTGSNCPGFDPCARPRRLPAKRRKAVRCPTTRRAGPGLPRRSRPRWTPPGNGWPTTWSS